MRASHTYYSTSQTAQMLGLSVGTVQRMVESGVLQAYTTQGGHRRILAASVRNYCDTQGVPGAPFQAGAPSLCIVHATDMDPHLQQALMRLPHVQLASHPLDLADLRAEHLVFFLDAHVSWLDWPELHRPQSLAPRVRLIIYNSADLSAEQQQALGQHAQLCSGPISSELIAGYLMGIEAWDNPPGETTNPH